MNQGTFKKGDRVNVKGHPLAVARGIKTLGDVYSDSEPGRKAWLIDGDVYFVYEDQMELVVEQQPADFRVGDLVHLKTKLTEMEFVVHESPDDECPGWPNDGNAHYWNPEFCALVYRPSAESWTAFTKPENVAWMAEREKERPGCWFLWWSGAHMVAAVDGCSYFAECDDGWSRQQSEDALEVFERAHEKKTAHPESVRRWREWKRADTKSPDSIPEHALAELPASDSPHWSFNRCAFCSDPGSKDDPLVNGMHGLCGEQKARREPVEVAAKEDPYASDYEKRPDAFLFEESDPNEERYQRVCAERNAFFRRPRFVADVVPQSKQKPVVHPWHADESDP
jgi:hypothetical protein